MRFLQVFRLPKRIEGQGVCLAARPRPLWRLLLTPLSQGCFTLEFEIRQQRGRQRVGHMEVLLDTQDARQVEIGMEVDPPYRGQGLGMRALHLIEPFLSGALGVELVTVRVRKDNARSRAFAEKAGYKMDKHESNGMIHFTKRIE